MKTNLMTDCEEYVEIKMYDATGEKVVSTVKQPSNTIVRGFVRFLIVNMVADQANLYNIGSNQNIYHIFSGQTGNLSTDNHLRVDVMKLLGSTTLNVSTISSGNDMAGTTLITGSRVYEYDEQNNIMRYSEKRQNSGSGALSVMFLQLRSSQTVNMSGSSGYGALLAYENIPFSFPVGRIIEISYVMKIDEKLSYNLKRLLKLALLAEIPSNIVNSSDPITQTTPGLPFVKPDWKFTNGTIFAEDISITRALIYDFQNANEPLIKLGYSDQPFDNENDTDLISPATNTEYLTSLVTFFGYNTSGGYFDTQISIMATNIGVEPQTYKELMIQRPFPDSATTSKMGLTHREVLIEPVTLQPGETGQFTQTIRVTINHKDAYRASIVASDPSKVSRLTSAGLFFEGQEVIVECESESDTTVPEFTLNPSVSFERVGNSIKFIMPAHDLTVLVNNG